MHDIYLMWKWDFNKIDDKMIWKTIFPPFYRLKIDRERGFG